MLEIKKFRRKKEDFVCENCGRKVEGNGYTNHCPDCLYSKHVDINPGDRNSNCHGIMKPIELVNRGDIFYIVHQCIRCGHKKNNKATQGDNFSKLIEISNKL